MLGYNINGLGLGKRREAIIAELKRTRPNWHLVMDDTVLADELTAHVRKGVIYRSYDPFGEASLKSFDNTFWMRHSPEAIAVWVTETMPQLVSNPKIVFSIGNNEPTTAGYMRKFLDWCIKLMDVGKRLGVRFAVAEIAVAKTIWHDEVRDGVWDAFLQALDEHRGFHIFTVHEYTTGILPATLLPDYPLNLDQPQRLVQSQWQHAKINLENISGNYHIGRVALVSHVRPKQIGLDPFKFVVTECAFDWMDDTAQGSDQRRVTMQSLKERFKPEGYDALRGSTGHKLYHEWLMQQTGFSGSWGRYMIEQYKWLIQAYPDECDGLTMFTLNENWDKPQGHDMMPGEYDEFRQLVSEVNTMQDVWQPEMVERMVSSAGPDINIRAAMSTRGTQIIGTVTSTPRKVRISEATLHANDYDWHKIIDGNVSGYVAALDILRIQPVADAPPVDPEPEPEPPTPEPTPDIDALVEQKVQEYIEAQRKPVMIDVPFPNYTYTTTAGTLEQEKQFWKMMHHISSVILDRLNNPTPTLSQIASAGYSTLATDEDVTITDVILNGDSEAA